MCSFRDRVSFGDEVARACSSGDDIHRRNCNLNGRQKELNENRTYFFFSSEGRAFKDVSNEDGEKKRK